jgi:FkbM family methyltransferase
MIAEYDGFKYKTNDIVFYNSINQGRSEPYPRELDVVKKYLSIYPDRNNTFIDVGGHIGTTSLPYGRLFKNVIAYEPNIESYSLFLNNLDLNNSTNIKVYNKGVYNKTTSCKVVAHEGGNSGCFYIQESNNGIPVVRIDDEQIQNKVDFIKIDTEGSELYVLEGAIQLIKRDKPLINLETNGLSSKYFGYSETKIFDLLTYLGYERFDDDNNNPFFYCK